MRRPLMLLFGILALGVIRAVGSEAATLALYDDFSSGQISAANWQDPEIVREIRSGRLALALRQSTYPHTPSTDLDFVNPGSIQSFRADARLTGYTAPPGGNSRLRLRGNYYSDGTTGSGATGDVRAQLFLRGTASGVDIRYNVYKCADSDCSTWTDVVPATTVKSAALGETYTLGIAWNGAVFTFRVDGADTVVNPADCAAYPTCQAVVRPTPNVVEKKLSAQLNIGAAGGEGYAAGDFDNVYVNGVLYDNFDGPPYSGPQLDPARWANLELVQQVQSGKFVSAAAGTGAVGTNFTSRLHPANQNGVTALRADVAVTAFQSTNSSVQARVLNGAFYNVGSSRGPSDETGNVYAHIRVHSNNGGPLTVRFSASLCNDVPCEATTSMVTDDLATVGLNDTHTYFLIWDGSIFTYGIQDLAISKTYDLRPFPAPVVKPPSLGSKEVRTRVIINQEGAYGYIAATYDNVYVNSDAVPPPDLASFLQQTVTGDVVSAGVGLRGTGTGTINLTGIPAGATIQKAYLYWATLGVSGTFTAPTLNGTAVSGIVIGQSDDPHWGALQSYAYRADVTSRVTGNGSYTIAGLPAGPTPPTGMATNDSQGASLVVLYSRPGHPARRIVINDGAVTLRGSYQYYATSLTGFTAPTPPTGAKLTFVVGDGQAHIPEYAGLNTTLLATNEFNGSNGNYSDTRSYDVSSALAGGATSASAVLSAGSDSLVWVAAILSVPVNPPPVISSVIATPPSPQVFGTPITVTANVTEGAPPYQCKWFVTTDPSWATYSLLRDWGACNVPWTPTVAGSYALGVWVRNSGTTADTWEAFQTLAYTVTAPMPITITSISPSLPSPQQVGTALSLTATVTGGTAPQSCKWLVTTDPTWATYTTLRTWTACSTPAPWTPTVAGTYQLGLWAQSSGNTTDAPEGGAAAVLSYTVAPMTVTVAATPSAPQRVGATVSLTATVTGGTAPQSCKWLVTTDPTWATYSVLRTWTACSTPAPWTPTVAGTYQLGVWARSPGSTADAPEGGAAAALAYTITPMTVTATVTPAAPQVTGTALTFTATVTGGFAPQQCKWLVSTDPSWVTYTTLRDWQPCKTPATWTPTARWPYQVGVWARSAGSTADAPEASAALAYEVLFNLAGSWYYSENGSFTYTICALGQCQTGTDPISESGTISVEQNGTEICGTPPGAGTSFRRCGTLRGNVVELSGIGCAPLPGLAMTFTENVATARGTVSADGRTGWLTVSTSCQGTGTYEGIPFTFRATGNSSVTMTR